MGRLSPERPLPNVPRPLRCGRSCSLSWGRATVWDVKRRRAAPLFIPLLGERVGACPGLDPGVRGLRIPVPRASTAPSFSALLGTYKGWGEGSSGQPPLGYAKVSPCGDLCTTPPVLEGAAALAPSPGGEGWGEGSSGQPPLGLRKRLLWARVGVRVFRAQCHPSARPAGPRSRLLIPLLGERVGVRGLPGNRPSGYAKVSPRGGAAGRPWPASGWPGSPTRSAPRPFRLAG